MSQPSREPPPLDPDNVQLREAAQAAVPGHYGSKALPQKIAQLARADQNWQDVLGDHADCTGRKAPSAVMLLFVLGNSTAEEARILFTRRSTTVRSHKGQVSLAGGRREANDFSPAMTAIRELHEEVGIPPHGVTVIGMLPPIQALDQSNIYPVVGITSQPTDQLQPAAEEVAMLFAAPWSLFAQTRAQSFDFNIFGNWRKSWLFATPHGNVWGLTAQILHGAALA